MTVIYFPRERVLFAADPPALTSSPFSFGTLRARDVLTWLRAVRPLDFDIMLTGEGEMVTRADRTVIRARCPLSRAGKEIAQGGAAEHRSIRPTG